MTLQQSTHKRWWEAHPRPALLLAGGFCLGPAGVGLLQNGTLDLLDSVVPVALVALGILLPILRPSRMLVVEMVPVLLAAALVVGREPGWLALDTLASRSWRAAEISGAVIFIAVAGSWLLGRVKSSTERHVVVVALLLLVGGVADFSAVPALAVGAIAAGIWRTTARAVIPSTLQDVDYACGPLMAAMLLLAGARLEVSDTIVVLAGALVLVAFATRRWAGQHVDPGLLMVSVAIDLTRGISSGIEPVIHAAVIATVVVQLVASAQASPASDETLAAGAIG